MKIKVVAAILDLKQLTLYKEDGKTHIIEQGDPSIRRILDEITPIIQQGQIATIDLDPEMPTVNPYHDFQEKSGGVVRFFRVAKKFLTDIIAPKEDALHLEPVSVIPPERPVPPAVMPKATPTPEPKIESAIDQIMERAVPVNNDFDESDHKDTDTMIAVVNDTVIPGVENLRPQFARAAKLGSTIGVENFLKRIAAVIKDRGHTIDELLRFMERGDLPIADDGSIVAYKVLKSSGDKGYFVDCHTSKVKQRVGSFVCQDKVDPSRRTECSTGLHIARRGYLSGFPGNTITLVKVAPEDVIAVPINEPNKMRARGYHIISEIPTSEHDRLRSNQPMQAVEAQKLLGMGLKGQHIGRIEEVRIRGTKGDDIVVTPLTEEGRRSVPKVKEDAPIATALDQHIAKVAPIDPKAVATKAVETKAQPKVEPKVEVKSEPVAQPQVQTETRQQKVKRLYDAIAHSGDKAAAKELLELKRVAKQPWAKLGLPETAGELAQQTLAAVEAPKPVQPEVAQNETRQAKAGRLVATMRDRSHKLDDRKRAAAELLAFKKASKVNWLKLGISGDIESEISSLLK